MLSGSFSDKEKNWTVGELELFAIYQGATKLQYVLQRPKGYNIYSDHKNHTSDILGKTLLGIPKPRHAKLQRWVDDLMALTPKIIFIDGTENIVADMISILTQKTKVNSITNHEYNLEQIHLIDSIMDPGFKIPDVDWIRKLQQQEKQMNLLPNDNTLIYHKEDDLYKIGKRIYIPNLDEARLKIIILAHSINHRGIDSTINEIVKVCDWPNMKENVKAHIQTCLHCKSSTTSNRINYKLGHQVKGTRPFQVLHLDFFTLGDEILDPNCKYLLTIKDSFTHLVKFYPSANASAETTAKALIDYCFIGLPETIIMDSGTHFKTKLIDTLCKTYCINQRFTLPYVHHTHGTVERAQGQLLILCRKIKSELRLDNNNVNWSNIISSLTNVLNSTPISRLGKRSPIELVTGTAPITTLTSYLDVSSNKEKILNIDWHKKHFDLISNFSKELDDMHNDIRSSIANSLQDEEDINSYFTQGEYVLKGVGETSNKMELSWIGPYKIVKVKTPHTYEIESITIPKTCEEVHINRLKYFTAENFNPSISYGEQILFVRERLKLDSITNITRNKRQNSQTCFVTRWINPNGNQHKELALPVDQLLERYPTKCWNWIMTHAKDNTLAQETLDRWLQDNGPFMTKSKLASSSN